MQSAVNAFVRGAAFIEMYPDDSAQITSRCIGVNARFIQKALNFNKPNINAIRNQTMMQNVLEFMIKLGYVRDVLTNDVNLDFLDYATKRQKPG